MKQFSAKHSIILCVLTCVATRADAQTETVPLATQLVANLEILATQPDAAAENVSLATASSKGQTPAPQVRMRWQDFIAGPDGAKRLASLNAAITKMKSLDSSAPNTPDYRRSWHYWANIHGYYGPQSADGTVAQQIQFLQDNGLGSYASFYSTITDQIPPDATAQQIWATCQHSPNSANISNFFGWHRMYLYYLERVLRWAAHDDTLRLPYWDYTDPAHVGLPAEFQTTTSTFFDPLRRAGINNGSTTLNPSSTNVDTRLPEPDYLTFEYGIEQNVHGYVHCTVGPRCPVAHMGDVPVAANDPIFYEHHANIDRIWACWQNLHPTVAPGPWQNQPFEFVDETGTPQTQPVKNFLDSTTLGYVYDNFTNCFRVAPPAPPTNLTATTDAQLRSMSARARAQAAVLGGTSAVHVDRPLIKVDINIPRAKLQEWFSKGEGAVPTQLVLRDVTAQSPPGVLFDIYIAIKDQPAKEESAKEGRASREFVGTISWFGAFRHHGKEPSKRTLQFDVTSPLRKFADTPNLSGLTVSIEATTGEVPANPSKADALQRDAAKAFRPEAKVQIAAIELTRGFVVPEPQKR